jgi:hypothetical protein
MVNLEPLIDALNKIGCSIESPRIDIKNNKDGTKEEILFENPKIYKYAFQLFIYTENNKQRKRIERAIEASWFSFKNRVPCRYTELIRIDRKLRRGVIVAAWPRPNNDDHDEVGELFIDVLSKEIEEPGSSEILIEALNNADKIIDEMLGRMEKDAEESLDDADSTGSCIVDSMASSIIG